jgi:hypothetical protein
MIEFKDLSDYECKLINESVIPQIKGSAKWVDIDSILQNEIYKSLNNVEAEKQKKRVIDFLCENDFFDIVNGGTQYNKNINTNKLSKAGSLERFYELVDKEYNKINSLSIHNDFSGSHFYDSPISTGSGNNIPTYQKAEEKQKYFGLKKEYWFVLIFVAIIAFIYWHYDNPNKIIIDAIENNLHLRDKK